jgi:hypothetical protein
MTLGLIEGSWALPVFFLLSLYGWGRLCRPFCDRRLLRFHALSIVFGLALLNAIGGVLNLLGLAKSGVLLGLMIFGAAVAGFELIRARPWTNYHWDRRQWPVVAASVAALTACVLLVPTGVFNLADDFRTYCIRAVRMSQTGSVGGNPFDFLGLDGLGSQSFFHGFFLAGNDIRFLQGFDAVSCFAICLLLTAELSVRWRLPWVAGLLAVLCVAFINPQQVNISALYSGAAAVMATFVCGILVSRNLVARNGQNRWQTDLSVALAAGLLVTLKSTPAIFGVFFLGALYFLLLLAGHNWRETLKSAVRVAGVTTIIALPWMLVCARPLLKARAVARDFLPGAAIAVKYSSVAVRDVPSLFSNTLLQYGNRPLAFYSAAVICVAAGGCGLFWWLKRPRNRDSAIGLALAAAGLSVPAVVLVIAHFFTADVAIRYWCPTLIGAFAVGAVAFLRLVRSRGAGLVVSAWLAVVLILFNGSFGSRLHLAATKRTVLSFPVDSAHVSFSSAMVSPFQTDYMRSIQTNMAAGATALVWVVTPFQMDFARNHLLTVNEGGLVSPLLQFPAGAAMAPFEDYLRKNGIRYVLMETNGYGVPPVDRLKIMAGSRLAEFRQYGEYDIYLRKMLLALAAQNPVRFVDDRMLLFELKPESPNRVPENK